MTRQFNIGMIGGGQISRAHVMAYYSLPLLYGQEAPRSFLSKIAEIDETTARNAAGSLGFKHFTGDWKQVTRTEDVDLVDVITPTYLHKEQSIDALEHGKSIICEKPLATTAQDSREMYEAARKAGVLNAVGFNYRKLPSVTFAKNLITGGFIGQICDFRGAFLEDWGGDFMPRTWRFEKKKAGAGALGDLGSHVIDLARFLVGEISSVCGIQQTYFAKRTIPGDPMKNKAESDVDDSVMALVKFSNTGALGRIEASWSAPGRKVALQFEVNGMNGSVFFDLERPNELQVYSHSDDKDKQGYRTVLMGPVHPFGKSSIFPAAGAGLGYEDSLVNEIHDVLVAMERGDGAVEPSFYDGWKVCQIIESIQKSHSTESWQNVG